MRRTSTVATVLAVPLSVLLGCTLVEQSGPSAGDVPPAGYVDMSESGFALAFPDGWSVATDPPTGSSGSTLVFEPGLRELVVPVVAAMPPSMHDRCVVADIAPLVDAQPDWSTVDDVVAGYELELATDPRWVGIESTVVDLPAGRTGHIARAVDSESESVSTWFFSKADAWFSLECVSHSDLGEDWRPIAETFEFRP